MNPTVRYRPSRSRYELVADDDTRVGLLDYREEAGVVTMWHTEVDPGHGGQGYGGILVKGALDDVRARGLKVICSRPDRTRASKRGRDDPGCRRRFTPRP